MSIHLSPELERRIAEAAEAAGTTADHLLEERLSEMFPATPAQAHPNPNGHRSLADAIAPYIGVVHSSEFVPGGARMSENTGEQFAQGMVEKRAQGRL